MTVKVGDKIRIVKAEPVPCGVQYEEGDIFYVSKVWEDGKGVDVGEDIELYAREFEVVSDAFVAPEISHFNTDDLNGKILRIYTGTDVFGAMNTHVTVGIDEATGVMYVLGMKTEVVE